MRESSGLVRGGAAYVVGGEHVKAIARRIDRREWWLWLSAISIIFLLGLGIASFSSPALVSGVDGLFPFFLRRAIRGLLCLLLAFSFYVVYEQTRICRLRRAFADQLYWLAAQDPLTGLFNRRHVEHWLGGEIARCQRYGTPLTMMLFDLDAFKEVNDEHGHTVGDNVLKVFAERLKKATRGSDVVARYGGDEFVALLPDCKPDGLQHVLERLEGIRVPANGSTVHVRFSVGWTEYKIGESLTDFLKRADASLYVNKRRPKRAN